MEIERPDNYESITILDIQNKKLTELPSWIIECKNLKELDCSCNKITHLDNLPPGLKELYCGKNNITNLDNLPLTLEILFCYNNEITHLDYLPQTLKKLYCQGNKITHLDNLPQRLKELECSDNPFKYTFKTTLKNIKKYNKDNKINYQNKK